MNTLTSRLILAGVLSTLTLISGVAVSKAGRPLNAALFNLHKLIALATVVLIVLLVKGLYSTAEGKAFLDITVMVLAGVLFLALGVTGGMLSFEKEWPGVVHTVHQVVPLLSLAFSAVTIYLFARSGV